MDQLGVFAKYWQPGTVKTRLAVAVGDQAAAELFRLFLEMVLRRATRGFRGRRVLAYAPAERASAFAKLAGDQWLIEPQADGDLGARMSQFFSQAFADGCSKVVLLGADSPDLPAETIATAFAGLDLAKVVLGPSADGGYYLIGMREFLPPLFQDIAWSSGQVYDQTTTKLAGSGIPWQALPMWYDVDEVADLRRLRVELSNIERIASPEWEVSARLRSKIDEVLLACRA